MIDSTQFKGLLRQMRRVVRDRELAAQVKANAALEAIAEGVAVLVEHAEADNPDRAPEYRAVEFPAVANPAKGHKGVIKPDTNEGALQRNHARIVATLPSFTPGTPGVHILVRMPDGTIGTRYGYREGSNLRPTDVDAVAVPWGDYGRMAALCVLEQA